MYSCKLDITDNEMLNFLNKKPLLAYKGLFK